MKKLICLAVIAALAVTFYMKFSLFVIAPMATMPEGATLVTNKLPGFNFIDSADGYLLREQGTVGIKEQIAVIGKVSSTAKIYMRLPYMKLLYLKSTGGDLRLNRWSEDSE